LSKLGFQGVTESGAAFRITNDEGESFTGTLDLVNPGRDLGLVVNELDDALLRFTLEGGSPPHGPTFLFGYVIAFGDSSRTAPARELAAKMASLVTTLG
jgi:hypothetical protein